jgi:hypothetical protein
MLLIQEFTWIVLSLIIALFLLGFFGNALVRGQLACRYCKQREIGCPAEQVFDTTKYVNVHRTSIRGVGGGTHDPDPTPEPLLRDMIPQATHVRDGWAVPARHVHILSCFSFLV